MTRYRYMDEVDFEASGALWDWRALLRVDGNARLEGALVEHQVLERVARPAVDDCSNNFWFASTANWRYRSFYLVEAGGQTSAAATAFAQLLRASSKFDFYMVEYEWNGDALHFYLQNEDGSRGPNASEAIREFADDDLEAAKVQVRKIKSETDPDFMDEVHKKSKFLHHERRPARATNHTNAARTEVVLDEIEQAGIVKELLVDRIFVNQVLNRFFLFIGDLDTVAMRNGKLLGFEIKRKYPSREGYFGINVFLHNMFRAISDLEGLLGIAHLIISSSRFEDINGQISPINTMQNYSQDVIVLYKLLSGQDIRGGMKKAFVPIEVMSIGPEDRETYMHEGFRILGNWSATDLPNQMLCAINKPKEMPILSLTQVLEFYPRTRN